VLCVDWIRKRPCLRMTGLGWVVLLLAACQHPPAPDVLEPAHSAASASPTPSVMPDRPARNMVEYRVKAARKIQQSNPQLGFEGPVPDPLASIPVLLVHLNANGTVRRVEVLRTPHYFPHTVEVAKRAVERAQPFESVAHLPKPWQFSETFLFNDDLKFQLRTLVELTAEN
jgi:hypothetical protein